MWEKQIFTEYYLHRFPYLSFLIQIREQRRNQRQNHDDEYQYAQTDVESFT